MSRSASAARSSAIAVSGGWRLLLSVVPAAFVLGLFIYPVGRLLALTIGEGNGFADVLGDPRIRSSLWFTLWQAAASTILTVVAALPLTWVVSRFRFPGRDLVRAAVTVPFVLPTVVVGVAFAATGMTGSVWAILAAHVFYNLAVVVRTVGGVWSRLDPSLVAAARTLGASPWTAFRTTTAPLLAPALAAAASIVFLFSFTSFGVVLILGGLRYRTIEVEIYQQAMTFLDLPAAGALAVLQLVGVVAVMAVYSRYQESRAVRFGMVPESSVLRLPATTAERGLVAGIVITTLAAQMMPLLMLVARSTAGGGAGWRFLVGDGPLAIDPLRAVGASVRIALIATAIAVVVGGAAATVIAARSDRWGRSFDVVLMLPLGTSAVTIGLGFLVALGPLRTSFWLIPLAHALIAIPFVVRATVPTLRSIRLDLREAAAVLGAPPRRVWREIDLPIVARALAVGAGFAAALSLGEFGATSFIVRPDTLTLPTMILRLLGRPGAVTYSGAMAASVLLMVTTAVLILAVDRLRSTDIGTF
jgi:thiamine transport system permease protein